MDASPTPSRGSDWTFNGWKVRDKMIDLFLLVVTIANCILFIIIMDWCKMIKLYYASTCTYFKSIRDYEKNIQDIHERTEKAYQLITEQYDEVAKLMGWRTEKDNGNDD